MGYYNVPTTAIIRHYSNDSSNVLTGSSYARTNLQPRQPLMSYTPRIVDTELDELLHDAAAIALDGPKGVGKTATAERRAATIIALDDPLQRDLAAADIDAALKRTPPVLIDEWQRLPYVWDAVRRAVDRDETPSQFLLTGSASLDSPATHSGAGRILRVRMHPLSLAERGLSTSTISLSELLQGTRPPLGGESQVTLADYAEEVVASGFPAIRRRAGRTRTAQLDGYLARIVDRDFLDAGHAVRRPATLMQWMRAYAAATSTVARLETIRDAATGDLAEKPAKRSTQVYRDILSRLWILDPLPAWLPSANVINELTHAPKHHLADPALAARLLGVTKDALLTRRTSETTSGSGPILGALFESLVTQSVRVYAQAAMATVHHLRTERGRQEVDIIVRGTDHRVVAIEVKLGGVIDNDDVRHLHWLRARLGESLADAIVVTTGPVAYRRADGIGVVPAALMGP